MAKVVEDISKAVTENVNRITPKKTGKLLRSHKLKRSKELVWHFEEHEPYGDILRLGARRHPIVPIKSKALYNAAENFGPVARVMHPGIKKNDYVNTGIDNSRSEIRQIAAESGVQIGVYVIRD